jgi:hypothetical protein
LDRGTVPKRQRVRRPITDEWAQLRLLCTWPEQETYERIRPIVLFGQSPTERARQTGTVRRSLYRKAAAFTQLGLAGLPGEPPIDDHRRLPEPMRQAIRALKAEHTALNLREIATICGVPSGPRLGRRPSHHMVEKVLAEEPLPPSSTRRFPPYADIPEATQCRLAIIHLHVERWNVQSIAAYLQTSRPTVFATLRRWATDTFADLADHSHRRKKVALKTDLKAITEVRRLQENPELGEFRIHAALKQQCGIDLMADWHFAQAKTWPELQISHARWQNDYNAQDHWAHLKRADQRSSPNDVLSFMRGKEWQPEQVHQIFRVARGERSVRPNGYLRFRYWDLYSERGLARHHVAVWLAADVTTVTIEYAHQPLAQYSAIPDAQQQRFKEVALLQLFENHFPSPQLSLWEPTTVEWRHAIPRAGPTSRHPRGLQKTMQPLLFPTESLQAATV